MTKLTATVLDTAGIQSYIFGSNRLRENIGGSYLVGQATEQWAREALKKLGKNLNQSVYAYDPADSTHSPEPRIHIGKAVAELLYAGGGNTLLLFASKAYAVEFVKILSRRILEEAPGIQPLAAHREFDWEAEKSLHKVFQILIDEDLPQKKQLQPPSAPLLGLSVTADCQSTQLVAIDTSHSRAEYGMPKKSTPYRISREIAHKLKSVDPANRHLKQTLFSTRLENYEIPRDFDEFGRTKGDISYIAVVHADGNNMGQRFQTHGQKQPNNEAYVVAMRSLSNSVNQAGIQSLETVAQQLINATEQHEDGSYVVNTQQGAIALHDNYLPFRPLVYGGDDVTFVCDGRLGLALATAYLQAFESHQADDGKDLNACAGICIVKVHYPFARAYEMSEALCQQGKGFVRACCQDNNEKSFSAVDWHIAASGLLGTLGDIRQREYTVLNGNLTMRPIRLQPKKGEWRTWESFKQVINGFGNQVDWQVRRNKMFTLREVLRQGSAAVEKFLTTYQDTNLPEFPAESGQHVLLKRSGWIKVKGERDRCGYFDAIEALDFYCSLEEEASDDSLQNND